MQNTVSLEIANIGEAEGTIGWLAKQPIKIKIGTGNKTGGRCCWVHIGDRSEMVSMEGYVWYLHVGVSPKSGINPVKVDRETSDNTYGVVEETAFNTSFTDAAWEAVQELISLAQAEFVRVLDEQNAAAPRLSFTVSVDEKKEANAGS